MPRKHKNHKTAKQAVETTTPNAPEAVVEEAQVVGETPAVGPQAEAKAPSKPLADRGRGRPEAKRIMNPQPTLELKKKFVREAGGTMEFKGRQWTIVVKDRTFLFPSRQMAGMTAGELCAAVGIEIAKAA